LILGVNWQNVHQLVFHIHPEVPIFDIYVLGPW